MTGPLEWDLEKTRWPNAQASRFVTAGGLRWHVQVAGESGPPVLLLHGTGASTHSWAGLLPRLARRFRIVAPDLPGHAFSALPARGQLALPAMAQAVGALCAAVKLRPAMIVGHSAGAAIGARMALDKHASPNGVVSLCGALLPFPGAGAVVFPALAKLLFLNPFAAPLIARMARDPEAVARLIRGTGSRLDAEGLALYGKLLGTTRHVAATIGMMARWDLQPLARDLPRLGAQLTLVAAARDRAVPPDVARQVAARVKGAELIVLRGVGHLAHEEAPDKVAEIVAARAAAAGL